MQTRFLERLIKDAKRNVLSVDTDVVSLFENGDTNKELVAVYYFPKDGGNYMYTPTELFTEIYAHAARDVITDFSTGMLKEAYSQSHITDTMRPRLQYHADIAEQRFVRCDIDRNPIHN